MGQRIAVMLLIAACGDGLTIADAPPEPTDDLRGLVTVQYQTSAYPLGGHRVVFQNADSSLVLATRTQSDGTANAFMAPGGFVTIVEPYDFDVPGNWSWTWAGVKPGDHLVLDRGRSQSAQVTINLTLREDPGAVTYVMNTPCTRHEFRGIWDAEDVPATIAIPVTPCTGSVSDVLVTSFDNFEAAGIPMHFLYRTDAPIAFLSRVEFTGPYLTPATSTITATAVPTPGKSFYMTQELGEPAALYSTAGFLSPDNNWSTSVVLPASPGMKVVTRLDELSAVSGGASLRVVDWGPFTGNREVDVGVVALHPLLDGPTFDLEARTVRWSEGSIGSTPDAVLVSIAYLSPASPARPSNRWTMLAPRTSETTVRFPLLPIPELNPQLGDLVGETSLFRISTTGGYEAIGSDVLGRLGDRGWPTTGPSGQVAYDSITSPGSSFP